MITFVRNPIPLSPFPPIALAIFLETSAPPGASNAVVSGSLKNFAIALFVFLAYLVCTFRNISRYDVFPFPSPLVVGCTPGGSSKVF